MKKEKITTKQDVSEEYNTINKRAVLLVNYTTKEGLELTVTGSPLELTPELYEELKEANVI